MFARQFRTIFSHTVFYLLGPFYMEWGTLVYWGWFLLFSRSGGHKTKETYPTIPRYPTPCKQGLIMMLMACLCGKCAIIYVFMGHLMTIWKQKNTFAVIMYVHYAKWTLFPDKLPNFASFFFVIEKYTLLLSQHLLAALNRSTQRTFFAKLIIRCRKR